MVTSNGHGTEIELLYNIITNETETIKYRYYLSLLTLTAFV